MDVQENSSSSAASDNSISMIDDVVVINDNVVVVEDIILSFRKGDIVCFGGRSVSKHAFFSAYRDRSIPNDRQYI